jgi:hypothetical protein
MFSRAQTTAPVSDVCQFVDSLLLIKIKSSLPIAFPGALPLRLDPELRIHPLQFTGKP